MKGKYVNLVEEANKRKIFVLIGPPSIGKSTWVKNNVEDPYIISRDDIVEEVSARHGFVYDEMFTAPPEDAKLGDVDEKFGTVIESPPFMKWQPLSYDKIFSANGEVQKLFLKRVSGAHPSEQDVVVDMTNMYVNSRKNALKAIEGYEEEYKKIAVVFEFKGGEDIIKKMAKKRAELAKQAGKNKTIPDHVIDKMMTNFAEVSPEEGFDEVIRVNTIADLKKGLENK